MIKIDINVKCIDQKLYFANISTIVSGGINETKIKFDFCPLWDGLGKVAIFYYNEEAVYNVVINNNECVVPYEVLASSGRFYFGVFAINEEGIRRTSDILAYKVVKGAFIEGQDPEAPTPNIYEQILAFYAKSMQYNEIFQNNVLSVNEELLNGFQKENEAFYNNFVNTSSTVQAEEAAFAQIMVFKQPYYSTIKTKTNSQRKKDEQINVHLKP